MCASHIFKLRKKVGKDNSMRLTQKVSFCFFMRGEKFRRITTEN